MNSARNQQRLNAIIRTRNISNLEAALIVGRSEQTVAAYRCGYRVIPGEVMELIEGWFNGDTRTGPLEAPNPAPVALQGDSGRLGERHAGSG